MEWIAWFFTNLAMAPVNVLIALANPGDWLAWGNRESLQRFIYYGASVELFFVFLFTFLAVSAYGFYNNRFMWGFVRVGEAIGNSIGRVAAWAGLLMVLQQVVIIFMQRVFSVAEISLGFGVMLTKDISWWAEMLKLHNAIVITLCIAYTFIQGGHVRVDLIYSAVSYRTKRLIDMFGSIVLMMPAAILIWLYGWFFLWRHLVVPNPSASATLDRMIMQARAVRWNVETIGFSPNGFNAYFLFKVLLVMFVALVIMQAWVFFYRSYLEWKEGEASEGKYLDKDDMGGNGQSDVVHETM